MYLDLFFVLTEVTCEMTYSTNTNHAVLVQSIWSDISHLQVEQTILVTQAFCVSNKLFSQLFDLAYFPKVPSGAGGSNHNSDRYSGVLWNSLTAYTNQSRKVSAKAAVTSVIKHLR